METAHTHKRPNYILIWIYLAVLTAPSSDSRSSSRSRRT
jgi:hypothetical protein